jgi:hypothetical protein
MRPSHRTRLEQPNAVARQPCEPPGDQLADRRRYACDLAARGQHIGQLPGEERVPLAAGSNDCAPPSGGRLAGKRGHELVHLGRA